MSLLALGLALWVVAHGLRRAAPGGRGALDRAIGEGPARGVVALLILAGLVLMVLGYRAAPFVPVYTPPAWAVHLNNLLMLGAVALLAMGHSKGRARSWLRHPMLAGVIVWAVAHLLVNGDRASLLLFGGLGVWAAAEMALINAREPAWVRPAPGPASGDVRLVLITIVAYAAIATVHAWLGRWPFPG